MSGGGFKVASGSAVFRFNSEVRDAYGTRRLPAAADGAARPTSAGPARKPADRSPSAPRRGERSRPSRKVRAGPSDESSEADLAPAPAPDAGATPPPSSVDAVCGSADGDGLVQPLGETDARALTEQVKGHLGALRADLLRLYEGQAHRALGYSSWDAYFKAEFGKAGSYGYRLLEAARVDFAIRQLVDEHGLPNEAQARELVPLLCHGEIAVQEVWARANRAGVRVTADGVRREATVWFAEHGRSRRRRSKPTVEPGGPPLTQVGELVELSPIHFLFCGDSTRPDDVARLCNGTEFSTAVLDPPYGIDHEGIRNDSRAGIRSLYEGILGALPIRNGVVATFQNPGNVDVWIEALKAAGHQFQRAMTYDRHDGEGACWQGWVCATDLIVFSQLGQPQWPRPADHARDIYVRKGREDAWLDGRHPTIKPFSVYHDLLKRLPSGAVFDPTAGSGTSLIAAAAHLRPWYGVEIDPGYCDTIRARFKQFLGKRSELLAEFEQLRPRDATASSRTAPANAEAAVTDRLIELARKPEPRGAPEAYVFAPPAGVQAQLFIDESGDDP